MMFYLSKFEDGLYVVTTELECVSGNAVEISAYLVHLGVLQPQIEAMMYEVQASSNIDAVIEAQRVQAGREWS